MIRLRRRAFPVRMLALCVGFVTVWCLGCRGFEPLLACAQPMDAQMGGEGPVSLALSDQAISLAAETPSPAPDDCICGCTSCVGSLAPDLDVPSFQIITALDLVNSPAACRAARCTPLVPPPQAAA